MACRTSSRILKTSSSSISHLSVSSVSVYHFGPGEGANRRHRRSVGREVQRSGLGALGTGHVLVEGHDGGELEIVLSGELLYGLELALVADLVGDQRDSGKPEVLGQQRHA